MSNTVGTFLIRLGIASFMLSMLMTFFMSASVSVSLLKVTSALQGKKINYNGLSDPEIAHRRNVLDGLTAQPHIVSKAASRVTLIGVTFDQRRAEIADSQNTSPDPDSETSKTKTSAKRKRAIDLTVDYSTTLQRAAVLVTNDPLALSVKAYDLASTRGLLAYESHYFPEIKNVPKQTFAGYRIAQYATDYITMPIDPSDRDPNELRELCKAMGYWQHQFHLTVQDVRYVLFKDPTEVFYDGQTWSSDGETIARLDDADIKKLCR